MGQAGRFLRRTGAADGYSAGGYSHWCPACDQMHHFATDGPQKNGARWSFNGTLERPSFSPSMNIRWGRFADPTFKPEPGEQDPSGICHYFVRAGTEFHFAELARELGIKADVNRSYIRYLDDCTHRLKGQIVPLPELPERLRDHADR